MAGANDKFVTSISYNGSIVVDKRGKFSKTQRKKDIRKWKKK
jgi:hypothetical protein